MGGLLRVEIRCREVVDPADNDLTQFATLLANTFADNNLWVGLDRIREFLSDPGPHRSYHVVVARESDHLLGGTIFSCAAATGAGFSEYLVLSREARGKRISRRLYDYRKAVLDRSARRFGHSGCPGLLIEVENPHRVPPDIVERERDTAMDAMERWRYFHHMGFSRLDFPYTMPPLRPELQPVTYLDLLFGPWSERLTYAGTMEAKFVLDSMAPTVLGWAPDWSRTELERLRRRLNGHPIKMEPLLPEERRYAQS
jgi:hypothetical protein